jgi:hypothetical protein
MWIKVPEWLVVVIIAACVLPIVFETINKIRDHLIAKEKRRSSELNEQLAKWVEEQKAKKATDEKA